ncbi:MAG TPA: discoidin domain-containing protein, partial [Polyangiaceae bacterium]
MMLVVVLVVAASSYLSGTGERRSSEPLADRTPDVMTFVTEGERMTDGVVATPGSHWNCAYVARFLSGGSVEWDLGRVVPIRRAFIQADNDDTYALVVSDDRRSWRDVWEAVPVRTGHGLRGRHTEDLDVTARYIRLEPRGGDGFYSVSELSLSSDRSGSWPPALEARVGNAEEMRGERERLSLSLLALAVAALSLGFLTLQRRHRAPLGALPSVVVVFALSAVLLGTVWLYAVKHRFNLVDDAYISLQYAKNWISGNGLVFNLGERVEGFTNFSWTALLTLLWPLSGADPDGMTRGAIVLASAFAVGGLWLVFLVSRRVFSKSAVASVFPALLVVSDDSYVAYPAVFALENQMLIVLTLGGLALFVYRPRHWQPLLGVSFALVGMTRPDGLLWGATFLVVQGGSRLFSPRDGDSALSSRGLARVGLAFAGVFAAYFMARFVYYGEPLPNTFHLKVGSTLDGLPRGSAYLQSYVTQRYG